MKTEDDIISPTTQTIEFNERDDHSSMEIRSANLNIISRPGTHNHGSSKVKIKNIVDFTWEHRYYFGQLLAVHVSGKYLAYGIKANNGNGAVRVVNKELEQRILIRDMRGAIQDLAFAHVSNAVLACVDHTGTLFVYSIETTSKELKYTKLLQVDADDPSPMTHRVIWCPYIPEEEENDGDEVSKLLVLTRGSKTELWSVAAASRLPNQPLKLNDEIKNNEVMVEIYDHTGTIVEATFSPDGTALATASSDGEVKFFQVFIQHGSGFVQQEPRCLHQWKPHDGKPISSLFFLDDHKNYHPDAQFWRFAVTGCDNNTELKLWSCELWICLQTIKFTPGPITNKMPVLKAQLDLSASYLLLSDIFNKTLYILSISKDGEQDMARINTISEFLLPYPMLSFAIVDAGQRRFRINESLEDLCHVDDEIDCEEDQLVVRMYLVQPKSLQECHIAFKPALCMSNNILMESITHDSLEYPEDLPEMMGPVNGAVEGNSEEIEKSPTVVKMEMNIANYNSGVNLMTPDAFSSPVKKDNNSPHASPQLGNIESASPSIAQKVQSYSGADEPLATSKIEEQALPSGGSSPSREVRKILSLARDSEDTEIKMENPEIGNNENWPDIPMCLLKSHGLLMHLKDKDGVKNVESNLETNPQTNQDQVVSKVPVPSNLDLLNITNFNNNLECITGKLDSVLELIQDQQQEISELRLEISRLQQEDKTQPIIQHIEATCSKIQQQYNKNLEQTLFNQMSRQHEFTEQLESIIKEKMNSVIPKIIKDVTDPVINQLKIEADKIDNIIKENLIKLIASNHVRDAITTAVNKTAKPTLESTFKEAFTCILLPGMEKVCQNMFKQVQDAFVRGTREYIENVDTMTNKSHDQLLEVLSANVKEQLQNEFSHGLMLMQENTIRTIRETVRENVSQCFNDVSSARSRATTPGLPGASPADVQARVLSLLQRGQINAAFQQALSASDLGLVVLVCENTEPSRVFSSGGTDSGSSRCVLQQPVLLSLIQQLSANLGHRTELKHRWLEEAVISLDPNDPVICEHMINVLLSLQNQVAGFINANPRHNSVRKLKMIAMAAQSLLKPI